VDSSQSPPDNWLEEEAKWLHRALFNCPPHGDLVARYVQAMRRVLQQVDPAQVATVQKVIDGRLDAEAVELALRRSSTHLLTRKLHALAILAEATEGYHKYFANDRNKHVAAFAALFVAALRTVIKKIQGRYLVWRHGLV
jgi:hypothetical protein